MKTAAKRASGTANTELETYSDADADVYQDGNSGAATLVWRRVLEGIYEGRFSPGQRLTEAELTNEFGVSRSSVREAFSRLAAEGAVAIYRHKGAVVRELGKAEMIETLVVLEPLIGLAAKLAAKNIDRPGARAKAELELRRLAAHPEESTAFDQARERNRFYRVLLALAGNEELRRLMSQIHVHPLRVQLSQGRAQSFAFADYISILAAVLTGNPSRAEQAARDHVAANIAGVHALDKREEAHHISPTAHQNARSTKNVRKKLSGRGPKR